MKLLDLFENQASIKTQVTYVDYHHGQHDAYVYAYVDDICRGQLKFSVYQGIAQIQWIEVSDEFKRQGIASAMLQALEQDVGRENIEWSNTTRDGTALKKHWDSHLVEYTIQVPAGGIDAWHSTPIENDIRGFRRLTHFGTHKAALDRLMMHGRQGKLYHVNLNIKKPLLIPDDIGDGSNTNARGLAQILLTNKHITAEEYDSIVNHHKENGVDIKYPISDTAVDRQYLYNEDMAINQLIEILEKQGYDSFVYPNNYEDRGSRAYIVFWPTQVKILHVDLVQRKGGVWIVNGKTKYRMDAPSDSTGMAQEKKWWHLFENQSSLSLTCKNLSNGPEKKFLVYLDSSDGTKIGDFLFTRYFDANNPQRVRTNSFATVDPQFRNQGYGKLLLLAAITAAEKLNIKFEKDDSGVTPVQRAVYNWLEFHGYIVQHPPTEDAAGFDHVEWTITPQGTDFLNSNAVWSDVVNENFVDGNGPTHLSSSAGDHDYSTATFNINRRKLNVLSLIKAGAILITYPHGEKGWETDNEEDWAFSLITLYNIRQGGWPSEAKKYIKPQSYTRAEQQINSSAPNLGSDKLVYDGKYNQILWSIQQLGIPDNIAFLDNNVVSENFADGKGPGRPGDSARAGIPKHATLAQLDRIVHSKTASKRKKQLAHWQANMRRGKHK